MVCLSVEGQLRRRIKQRTSNEYILKLINTYRISENSLRYIMESLPKQEKEVAKQAHDVLNSKGDLF